MITGKEFTQLIVEYEGGVRIHTTADIAPGVQIGDGSVIWAYAIVLGGVKTGTHCSIGAHTEVGRNTVVGDSVRIGYGVFLPTRSQIGHRVFIGPGARFADDRHPYVNNPHYRGEPPIIEDDVSVGIGAVILPGVVLGQGCVVGAGAVVTRNVPPYNTVVGNPARVLRPLQVEDILTGDLITVEEL